MLSIFLRGFLFYLISFSILGCAVELQDKDKVEQKKGTIEPVVNLRTLSPTLVKTQVQGMNEPNIYHVHLIWPEASGKVRISANNQIVGVLQASEMHFESGDLVGGELVKYYVEHLDDKNSEGVVSSFEVSVTLPKDIVLRDEIRLKENTKIEAERIFIDKTLRLTTLNFNLNLNAKEVIAEGGEIHNFPLGSVASRENSGRMGGAILIYADKGQGHLRILLSGEDGGPGRDGAITMGNHPGCAGTQGGNGGSAGTFNMYLKNGPEIKVSIENNPGGGGRAGRRGSVPGSTPASEAVLAPCPAGAPDGRDGVAGIRGQVCLNFSCQ